MAILVDMDELIIDDKKYVSSKRAAKITGYAKDYVGQLCREGRVTARLVGRSWYVLESAIHDHRFAEKQQESAISPSAAVFSSTWGAPKYEPAPAEPFPAIEKEEIQEESPAEEENGAPESMAQQLQDSWKAWFERVGEPSASVQEEAPQEEEVREETAQLEDEKATNVPIRAIHHEHYQPLPHEILARRTEISPAEEREEVYIEEYQPRSGSGTRVGLQIAGALVALVMAGLAVAGTGYFDKYILASQQFGSLAGVGFYNR